MRARPARSALRSWAAAKTVRKTFFPTAVSEVADDHSHRRLALGVAALVATMLAGCNGRSTVPAKRKAEVATTGAAAGAQAPVAPRTAGAWSPARAGLRARLVAAPAQVAAAGGRFDVAIEFENVGSSAVAVVAGDPFAFTADLRDASGRAVAPSFQRGDVVSAPQWDAVAPGALRSVPVSIHAQDGAASSHVDVVTSAWSLAPGRYSLSGRFTCPPVGSAPRHVAPCTASVSLPAIALYVR
jgi:hypothetical protein